MCRRLPAFLDRPPNTGSNFISYSSTLRGCPKRFSIVYSGGLSSSTAHFLILIGALKSRFINSIRFVPLGVVLTNASSPRTFALLSICSSVRGLYFLYPQGSADTFPSRPSEVYTPVHGVYTMFETHLQVSCRYAVHTLCTFLSLERE